MNEREQPTPGIWEARDARFLRHWKQAGRLKGDLLVLFLLMGFAFWINRGVEIKGLYMDDLYLWSCYGEQSFLEYVFPVGSTRFRFLFYLAAWLELGIIGIHVQWIVPINILLNAGIAYTLYRMARHYSRSAYVGALCGLAFLASRMSYYQIGQLYGLMETMALWMALGILGLLGEFLNDQEKRGRRFYWLACGLYFGICFVHERYMVLLPLFFLVLLCRRVKNPRLWAAPAGAFALVQAVRFAFIGSVMPAGTGHTQVAETFTLGEAVKYAASQVAYVFGINAGPEHLNGENFRQAPLWVMICIAAADLALLALVLSFLIKLVKEWKHCGGYLCTSLLFLGFLAGCIACSSVTVRVEMRWVYVSYAGALLYLSWLYGALTDKMVERGRWMHALSYLATLTFYVALMFPVELYYRGQYPNLYFWPNQHRYNSLAEETYGTYGDDIFGRKIYIIGNEYKMSDFTAETFFKVFDKKRKAEGTKVVHVGDIRQIGLVTDDMLVLQEDPEHEQFLDVTRAVRMLKCKGAYGYYEDGWMDEQAKVQVMAGESGIIGMDFYYPGEVGKDQWLTVYVDGEPYIYLEMEQNQMKTDIQVEPYKTVILEFQTNFYVPDAREQRGKDRLALLLTLTAD